VVGVGLGLVERVGLAGVGVVEPVGVGVGAGRVMSVIESVTRVCVRQFAGVVARTREDH